MTMERCGSWKKAFWNKLVILAVMTLTANLTACNNKQDYENKSKVSTDINELSKFIELPYKPKAVWWQTSEIGDSNDIRTIGPTDWRFNAVLMFDNKDIEMILNKSQLEYYSSDQIGTEIIGNMLNEHGMLEKETYKADIFSKSPLLYGVIIRIKQTNKLFVSLSTR